jgi:hypothetical protein
MTIAESEEALASLGLDDSSVIAELEHVPPEAQATLQKIVTKMVGMKRAEGQAAAKVEELENFLRQQVSAPLAERAGASTLTRLCRKWSLTGSLQSRLKVCRTTP